ncbi:rubrerythrin [Brachyspira pilosicoli B2904]|uniref:Rubrerythrin n=1 Tax=Brachyspira pilosicoli B2904 TaxID=1133568 RepID=J9UBZ5_BRAPL|nr:rubrerythrin family protein [Brachyspira pilosicoli]AFR69881.1 rubrerythrin [Brachyspira pilosicoli B2904]
MKDLKGTKTEKNLHDAFAGESMARNKYTYFASVARNEGYEQIAAIFLETAENEREHAKVHFKYLNGIGDTLQNLQSAWEGENYEYKEMYPTMSKEAAAEGFDEIAHSMKLIGDVEREHRERYAKLREAVKNGTVFKRNTKVQWKCRNCGYIYEGEAAPEICPACKHAKKFFEVRVESY